MNSLDVSDPELLAGAQRNLEALLEDPHDPKTYCGLDVAYGTRSAYAAAVVFNEQLEIEETKTVVIDDVAPYEPGLFAAREGQILIDVLQKLEQTADILIVDAHGIAHPTGFGLASVIGYVFDWPTIGCAKNLLFGNVDELGPQRGSLAEIRDGETVMGFAVRTRDHTNPVYASPGYRVSLETTGDVVLRTSNLYRIPEPLRQAHQAAESLRRENQD